MSSTLPINWNTAIQYAALVKIAESVTPSGSYGEPELTQIKVQIYFTDKYWYAWGWPVPVTTVGVYRRALRQRKRWGPWFTPIGKGGVLQTNLHMYFHLGVLMGEMDTIEPKTAVWESWHTLAWIRDDLIGFLFSTNGVENLSGTRVEAKFFCDLIDQIAPLADVDGAVFSDEHVSDLASARHQFEAALEREHRYLDVYTVTQKGIYDTRLLLTKPEDKFPPRIKSRLPAQSTADLKQAALCLAFDIPTACAFHICRATEALMLAYYEVLSGHPWELPKNRDWKAYIDHLTNEGAPLSVTTRLDEIRKMDRNAYAHPERNVTLEESPVQFELCTNVMFQMASEMDKKLNP